MDRCLLLVVWRGICASNAGFVDVVGSWLAILVCDAEVRPADGPRRPPAVRPVMLDVRQAVLQELVCVVRLP